MRICKGLVAAGISLLSASLAQAGFVVSTSRAPITTGTFAGKDGVTLFVQNVGGDTTDATFGNDIIYYDVSMAAPGGTVNPRFYIHTWDGTIYNTANPAANTKADLGWQGFIQGDATRDGKVLLGDFNVLQSNFGTASGATWEQGDFTGDGKVLLGDFNALQSNFNQIYNPASYVRFGSPSQFSSFFPVSFNPGEASQTFTDGQTLTSLEVTSLVLSPTTSGLPDGTATQVAFAVVPTGQGVTFSGSFAAHAGNSSYPFTITDAGGPLSPAMLSAVVPEPTAVGLVAVGAMVLRRKRR